MHWLLLMLLFPIIPHYILAVIAGILVGGATGSFFNGFMTSFVLFMCVDEAFKD